MIIDWHTHVHAPREQAAPFWGGNCPATIDNVLRLHDEVGLDLSVISNSGHYLKAYDRKDALPAIREANDYLAELRDKHKDRVVAFAVAIPGGGDDHLRELERAVKQNDLRAVLISSSHRRAYPDDDDARPFFKLVTELDIPVFMHPPSVGFGEERMKEFRLASSVGRPFDSCLALARLIVRVLDRPDDDPELRPLPEVGADEHRQDHQADRGVHPQPDEERHTHELGNQKRRLGPRRRHRFHANRFGRLADFEFQFAKSSDSEKTEDIQTFLDESVKDGCEGLMVKMLESEASYYEPSRRSVNWLKVGTLHHSLLAKLTFLGDS